MSTDVIYPNVSVLLGLLLEVVLAVHGSLTFEQRQIEGQSWWQNWPIVYALKLCFWVEDFKTNSLGSRPAIMKM